MTRRIIAFKENDLYFVSQEFNGDKEEAERRNPNTTIKANWEEIIECFDGVNSLRTFKQAVKKAENLYSYEPTSLVTNNELPEYEEVWLVVNGKLNLYSRYDEIINH